MALKKNRSADLKLHYNRTIELSIIVSLVLVIAAFMFFPKAQPVKELKERVQEPIPLTPPEPTAPDPVPPPPPKPPIVIPDPGDIIDDLPVPGSDLDPGENVPPPPAIIPIKTDDPDPVIFEKVEQMPEIIGGTKALYDKIEYPEIALRVGIHGLVVIRAPRN